MENNTKGIGFRNFRRFKEFPQLEFGNITYMVGRNNSGKSTMVKALLLITDYLQNQFGDTFSFDNNVLEDANIVTFGRAKCNLIDEPEIVFSYKLKNYDITINISGDNLSTKASVNKIVINDPSNAYEFTINYTEGTAKVTKKSDIKITNDIKYELQDISYEDSIELQLDELKRKYRNIQSRNRASKQALELMDQINKLEKQKENLEKIRQQKRKPEDFDSYYSLEYPMYFAVEEKDPKKITKEEMYGLLDNYEGNDGQVNKAINSLKKKVYEDEDEERSNKNNLRKITQFFLICNEMALKSFKKYREKNPEDDYVNEKFYEMLELENTSTNLLAWIYNFTGELNKEAIKYLGANPSKQSALFPLRAKDNAIAQAIHQFYQLKIIKGEKEHEFVKYWMNEFEVGQNFEIKFYAGEAYEFHALDKNGVKNHLSDKGMGSLQAMVLILNVASLIRINKKEKKTVTLLVEEPELNLHPALQSKLTDFFHLVNKEYGINFIIETHSEYMIRKTQLIAIEQDYINNQDINPNPFKVFYFHKKDGPYEMEFKEQGKFNKDFGPGFYNEASDISIEIIKNTRKNKS